MPTFPPDTSLSFQDIILRVAEEAGFAFYDSSSPDTPAAIPQDRQILDKIKRSINDGIDRMARAYPKWTSLRPQVSFALAPNGDGPLNIPNNLTLAAGGTTNDPSLYRLPWYITGRPVNGWQWSSQGSNFAGFAKDVSPEELDFRQRASQTASFPLMAAIVPSSMKGDPGSDRQTKAVRFWPSPDQAYLVTARFLVYPAKLVALQDRHIFGAAHDQTVLAFALWALKEHDAKDAGMRATYQARAANALAESIRIDQEGVQLDLGMMTDPNLTAKPFRYVNPGVDVVTSSMTPALM